MNWKRTNTQELISNIQTSRCQNLVVSPYSIPEAFRIFVEESHLVLELRYLSPDLNFKFEDAVSGIKIKIGESSGRIYQFIFDMLLLSDSNGLESAMEQLLVELSDDSMNCGSGYREQIQRELLRSEKEDILAEYR